ncbi:Glutamine and serine-rich protein 1 [Frankliniella fusca]|uniref:Glutamine and serine-rich protein 1 n=1 Tax=Frankliniella fusca TaxID=407009 RepID=A0AAE1GUB4_9NEOP|nr:Glutamine and serine-rich protein 1 [Frankliniella fusca]
MDPSWYYNRLSNASAFPPSSSASASEYHQQLTGQHSEGNASTTPASTSQLLQFNAGFPLSNPYSFYGIPHASKPVPYAAVGQNRALATNNKSSSDTRENYNAAHNQSNVSSSTYFDQQTSSAGAGSTGWAQHNPQLNPPSAFGVLPHESITSSSTSPKTGSSEYPFNAYSPHNVGQLTQSTDYKGSNSYPDVKKSSRPQSPISSTKSSSPGFPSYPGASANTSNNYAGHESSSRSSYSPASISAALQQQQPQARSQSFSSTNAKLPHPTKAQSKHYPDVSNPSESRSIEVSRNSEHPSSSSQRYGSASKQAGPNEQGSGTGHFYDQLSFPYHYLPEAAAFNRMKSMSNELYLASQQNGSDCGKKTVSQTQQPPATSIQEQGKSSYSVYNNPVTSLPTSSPQRHLETPCIQNSPGADPYKSSADTSSDITLARNQSAHHQNIAYSSVITRAVSTPDPVPKPVYQDTRLYERRQDNSTYSKQCWETGIEKQNALSQSPDPSLHQKKYHSTSVPSYDSGNVDMTSSQRQQPSRSSVGVADKQSSYYDSAAAHQTALQNLSSYRDDPMSIIKDLQNYQSLQNNDSSKSSEKSQLDQPANNTRKRKSADKQAQNIEGSDFYNSRFPPPAHNNVTFQQQQSGYFPNFSPPSSSRSYPVQVPHYASHAQALMSQHQGLYTPPFFSPFSLPGSSSTPTPNASTSDLPPAPETVSSARSEPAPETVSSASSEPAPETVSSASSDPAPETVSSASSEPAPETVSSASSEKLHSDDVSKASNSASVKIQAEATLGIVPKVVVPNVEEELSFLKDAGPVTMIKSEKERKSTTTSGFEASFLKFLQGARDTSPPPSRRASKSRYVKASQAEQLQSDKAEVILTNGGLGRTTVIPSSEVLSDVAKSKIQDNVCYDSKDDPRYFPLPKTDAEREVSSDSDCDAGPLSAVPVKNQGSKSQERKPVAAIAPRTASSKEVTSNRKSTPVTNTPSGKRGRKRKSEAIILPRRETSKRKAKEKMMEMKNTQAKPKRTLTRIQTLPGRLWLTSQRFLMSTHLTRNLQKKKAHKQASKLSKQGRKRSKHSLSDDAVSTDDDKPKRQITSTGSRGRKRSQNVQGTSVKSNSVKSGDDNDVIEDDLEISPFKLGDFVVMKTDLIEKWPPIWRVDGKTLLQKFEPFEHKGAMLYRNISTYSGWSPQTSHIYKSAHVVFKVQNRSETVVEFVRDEMADDDDEALVEFVKETSKYQDNFEVYIQTLISQALDSNFLTEIFQEKDLYFLNNVKTVDDIVDDKRKRFLKVVNWRPELEASIATWPCFNIINEVSEDDHKICAACDKPKVAARVLLYGQPYNSTTLEGCQPDPKLTSEKDFFTCRLCLKRIELYNKVAHQKYLMYIECSKRVNEKKQCPGSKDTTVILNELLADDSWLSQLFRSVRISWAQIDHLEHSLSKN